MTYEIKLLAGTIQDYDWKKDLSKFSMGVYRFEGDEDGTLYVNTKADFCPFTFQDGDVVFFDGNYGLIDMMGNNDEACEHAYELTRAYAMQYLPDLENVCTTRRTTTITSVHGIKTIQAKGA